MKVSIIVPVYNVEKYIYRCIESVASQSYNDIECIIVNDCTPDASCDIAKDFIQNYEGPISFSLIEHDHNQGLSAARNTGIKQSTGDYIFFLDSDDILPDDAISDLVTVAEQNSCPEIVMGYTLGVDANGNSVEVASRQSQVTSYESNEELFHAYLSGNYYVIACNKLIRRDIFDKHKTFFREGITHEDVMWSFEVSTYVQRVIACDKVTYLYYLGDTNSISRSRLSEKRVKDSLFILKKKAEYIGRTCDDGALAIHIKNDARSLIYVLVRQKFGRKFVKECIDDVTKLEQYPSIRNANCTIPWYRKVVYRMSQLYTLSYF